MTEALLEMREVDVHYGAVQALHEVNLRVEAGQIVALLGANGAGKSTTLRAISGLLKPTRGEIRFRGQSIVGQAAHTLVKRGMTHVPEGRGIFANFTVEENLKIGGYSRQDAKGVQRDIDKSLDLFPRLRERLYQCAGTLSGGEQQMLAIARALVVRPVLMLLDEPSLGLAPQMVQQIYQIIGDIHKAGTTVLLVEQNARMALDIASFGYVLEVGAIVCAEEARTLKLSDKVRRAYLGVG